MFDFIDAAKTIGSVGGLVSVSLLIYDRVIRSRPVAFVSVKNYQAHITIQNSVVETVIIDNIKVSPPMLEVRGADDKKSAQTEKAEILYTSREARSRGIFIVLKGNEQRSFLLSRFADFENANADQKIHIRLQWHSTQKVFLIPRYISLTARVGDLKALRDAALVNKV